MDTTKTDLYFYTNNKCEVHMQILSYNVEDDTFFVGLSSEEFEQLSLYHDIEYDFGYDFEKTNQKALKQLSNAGYVQMIKEAYNIQTVPFVCFVADRDASKIAVRSPHFPFAPLWNGYSPWKAIQVQEIDSLEVLKNISI